MLKISDVLPESAAAKAGLIADDVIVGMNGEGLTSTEFLETVSKAKDPYCCESHEKWRVKKPDMKELSLLPKPDSTGRLRMGIHYTPLGFSFTGVAGSILSTLETERRNITSTIQ